LAKREIIKFINEILVWINKNTEIDFSSTTTCVEINEGFIGSHPQKFEIIRPEDLIKYLDNKKKMLELDKEQKSYYSTADMIDILGVAKSTLIRWDKEEKLVPKKDRRGYRQYSEADRKEGEQLVQTIRRIER